MPFVQLKLAGSVTKEQKKELADGITRLLQEVINKPPQYTYVVFEEVRREDWAIGGKLLDDK
jgi:4-oxalocrotonate tautomerase